MRLSLLLGGSVLIGSVLLYACSGSSNKSGFDDPNANGGGSSGGNGFGNGEGGTGVACSPNPKNYDIPGNGCDDDGDGTVDNPPTCDSSAGDSAEDFAKALGICDDAATKGYGLVSAKFIKGFGSSKDATPDQHGVLPKFGDVIKPREGKMLGLLSTGYAQEYDGQNGAAFGGQLIDNSGPFPMPIDNGKDWNFTGKLPDGFPKAASGCQQGKEIHDVIDVVLTLRAPPNVSGIKFDFNFYSGEWPAYICSQFNDGFIAYLSAKGFNNGNPDNMSFDKDNNPVSVNNGFFDRCTAGVPTGCAPQAKPGTSQCPGGTSELSGTGFGIENNWCAIYSADPITGEVTDPGQKSVNGGATGWLTSQAPVQPGEQFTIEFIIWDTGDGILDSSVLLDNFTWAQGQVVTNTERPH